MGRIMAGNTFGKLFTVTTFGESHGPALGCIVDGCPPGMELSEADIDVYKRQELDAASQPEMLSALKQAEMVVAMSPFKQSPDYADVLLPVSPFTETSGTFVSFEGRVQSFGGCVVPFGQTRPAWKVLRVLGNFLDLPGFGYETTEEIRDECLCGQNISGMLNNMSGMKATPLMRVSILFSLSFFQYAPDCWVILKAFRALV